MSCNYILKNGNICKNTAKKSIKILDYCTRHYNILIQNSNTTPDNIDNILSELNLETDVTFINKGAFGSVVASVTSKIAPSLSNGPFGDVEIVNVVGLTICLI